MRTRSIDEWKKLLIGNTYSLLTVNDVVKIDGSVMSVCVCKCGNIKYAEPSRVFHGCIKSCGCLNNSENLSYRHTERHERNLEKLKSQFINNRFGNLVVQDVIINDSNSIVCVCKCECGVVREVSPKRLEHLKSCGCRSYFSPRTDLDCLKKEYVGKQINWFTVVDFYRDSSTNLVMIELICRCGNRKIYTKKEAFSKRFVLSCGCHHKTAEYKAAHKMSEEQRALISVNRKQFYLDHPEEKEAQSRRMKLLYENEPERRVAVGKRISNWFKSDKEGVHEWADHRRQYYKDHPEIGQARSQLYKDHPEIIQKIADKNREYNKNNPDKVDRINRINREIAAKKREVLQHYKSSSFDDRKKVDCETVNRYRDKRRLYNVDLLVNIIHPDCVSALCSGDIANYDIVKTKCPQCGEYAEHSFCNVFSFGRGDFKNSKPPLCKSCKAKQTSSQAEQEIADYISTFYSGECIRNDRSILNGKELDLYYPEKKIAIEFNGDYWHDEDHRPRDYHYNKFRACLDKGIVLISIFESEWNSIKDTIKEYLRDMFRNVEHSLSFSEDHSLMNNNYPCPYIAKLSISDYIEDSYAFKDKKIFTCGYSRIISNN